MFTQGSTKLTYYLPRNLIIMDCCMDRGLGRDKLNAPNMDYDTPSYLPHPYACQVFIGPVIRHILQQMPSLSKLSLCTDIGVVHGPSWTFLQLALSLPHLRQFEMTGLTFCPVVLPTETLELGDGTCAPLTAFRYEAILTRDRRYALAGEKDALSLVLERIHHSLAALALPSEPAPVTLMSRRHWPSLRELRLRGMRWAEPRTPIVLLFANMPKLRSLSLELAVPDGAAPEAIWPPGLASDTIFPWPELEGLTVANPNPNDELFANLPPCLRSLALPSCPRKCVKEWLWRYERGRHWFPPTLHLISASNLLRILVRCSASGLRSLEVEYSADEREYDLLRHLASSFSSTTSLTFCRYRRSEESVVSVVSCVVYYRRWSLRNSILSQEDIARPLAALTSSQTLCVNMDLEMTPTKTSIGLRIIVCIYERGELDRFKETLEDVAFLLARSLSQSLERVRLWMPSNGEGPVSMNFRVLWDGSGKSGGPRVQRETFTFHEREDVWGF